MLSECPKTSTRIIWNWMKVDDLHPFPCTYIRMFCNIQPKSPNFHPPFRLSVELWADLTKIADDSCKLRTDLPDKTIYVSQYKFNELARN